MTTTWLRVFAIASVMILGPERGKAVWGYEGPRKHHVDKSLFIKAIVEDTHKVIVIHRPDGWGKTFNIKLLLQFFDARYPGRTMWHKHLAKQERGLFEGRNNTRGSVLMKPLMIAQHKDIMARKGMHPCLWISFYAIGNEEEVRDRVLERLKNEFRGRAYLQEWIGSLNNSLKERFHKYRNYGETSISVEEMSREDVVDGLRFFSEVLHKYHKQKVYVIVEGYETPFLGYTYEFDERKKNEIMTLFRDIYCRVFNNNPYVEKGILTGVLRLADVYEEVFSHVDSVLEDTILDERFSEFFGFRKREVNEWLTKVISELNESSESSGEGDTSEVLRKEFVAEAMFMMNETTESTPERGCCGYTYNGYHCKPSSISDYIANYPSRRYLWVRSLEIRFQVISKRWSPQLSQSLSLSNDMKKSVVKWYIGDSVLCPVAQFRTEDTNDLPPRESLLLHYGCLTPSSDVNGNMYLNIPNDDEKLWFHRQITDYLERHLSRVVRFDLREALISGKFDKFRRLWRRGLSEVLDETFYDFLLVVMFDDIIEWPDPREYKVYLGMQNATSKVSAFFMPRPSVTCNGVNIVANGTAAVVVFHMANDNDLDSAARECVREMDDVNFRRYIDNNDGIKRIKKICVAFHVGNATVRCVEEDLPSRF